MAAAGGRLFISLSSLIFLVSLLCLPSTATYKIDNSAGLGRTFDGIGGLSGGGSTSKLLVSYPKQQRSDILDFLFKPNFGASLQILKVEIGGDGQSTDGTESSHMHNEKEENYQRGYEWWLMKEAKARNPLIKLSALSWTFPGWLKDSSESVYDNPQRLADYTVKWLKGAKSAHNLDIDYVGIWNERNYNITYIKTLRKTLNSSGLQRVQIVAGDGGWGIADDILKDSQLQQAVSVIGVHYPGTNTTANALKTNKTLWSSEDYSTFNDNTGAGCWARILNQNYVNGYMTSTISWNLIAAYYFNLPFGRDGLMTSMEPWSGHYVVESPIWVTAHTSQFTQIGWQYLQHGAGVGKLEGGGSYVTLVSPDGKDFSIIIETMSHDHSQCIRPGLPKYTVKPQKATFTLGGALAQVAALKVWKTQLGFNDAPSVFMQREDDMNVTGRTFSLYLDVDVLFTLTTLSTGFKGIAKPPPPSKPFPFPYSDDFESYNVYEEVDNFSPQIGVFEVRASGDAKHGKVNTQVVMNHTVWWCTEQPQPFTLGGNYNWTDMRLQIDVFLPKKLGASGVVLGARVDKGGCDVVKATGAFFVVDAAKQLSYLYTDFARSNLIAQGKAPIDFDTWFNVELIMSGDKIQCSVNGTAVFNVEVRTPAANGFVGYGASSFGLAMFDNFYVGM